jgi:hypothetical protein
VNTNEYNDANDRNVNEDATANPLGSGGKPGSANNSNPASDSEDDLYVSDPAVQQTGGDKSDDISSFVRVKFSSVRYFDFNVGNLD